MGDGCTGGILSNITLKGQPKPPAANEAGWKDTVIMYPGEVTRIIANSTARGSTSGTATSSRTRTTR